MRVRRPTLFGSRGAASGSCRWGLGGSPADLGLASSADSSALEAWPALPPSPVARGASAGTSPIVGFALGGGSGERTPTRSTPTRVGVRVEGAGGGGFSLGGGGARGGASSWGGANGSNGSSILWQANDSPPSSRELVGVRAVEDEAEAAELAAALAAVEAAEAAEAAAAQAAEAEAAAEAAAAEAAAAEAGNETAEEATGKEAEEEEGVLCAICHGNIQPQEAALVRRFAAAAPWNPGNQPTFHTELVCGKDLGGGRIRRP